MASHASPTGPNTAPMALAGPGALDIGMAMMDVINKSRCNQASASLTAGPGITGTLRYELYVKSTFDDLANTIMSGARMALIQDIKQIQHVLQMIRNYGGATNDGFLPSMRPIISVSEALLTAARQHTTVALLLDGCAAIAPPQPRSDEATASSSLSTPVRKDLLAQARSGDAVVAWSGAWTSTLSGIYPASLDGISESSCSSDSEDSSRLSEDTAATSLFEGPPTEGCTDDVAAQRGKA